MLMDTIREELLRLNKMMDEAAYCPLDACSGDALMYAVYST